MNAFTHGVGDKALWDRGGYWSSKGFDREPLYTAEQYRHGQREAVAAVGVGDERYAKLVSQVHYWMNRGDRAQTALDAAEYEIADLRSQLARKSQEGSACG